jgi:hypothetical protein
MTDSIISFIVQTICTQNDLDFDENNKLVNEKLTCFSSKKLGPTPKPTSFIIDKFKYLVVHTGYTQRLATKLSALNIKISKSINYEEDENENDNILYIKDREMIKASKDDKTIKYVNDKTNDQDGVIVFRCSDLQNAFNIISLLGKEDYCSFCGYRNIYSMQLVDDILIVNIDCESG